MSKKTKEEKKDPTDQEKANMILNTYIADIEVNLDKYLLFMIASMLLGIATQTKDQMKGIINYWIDSFKESQQKRVADETAPDDHKKIYLSALDVVSEGVRKSLMHLTKPEKPKEPESKEGIEPENK